MPCCASAPKESRPICIEQLDSSRLQSCCCNYYLCLLGLYREIGKENGNDYIMITGSVYRQLRWIPRSSSCRQLRLSYTGHSSIYEPTLVQPIRIVSSEKILWAALMEYIHFIQESMSGCLRLLDCRSHFFQSRSPYPTFAVLTIVVLCCARIFNEVLQKLDVGD